MEIFTCFLSQETGFYTQVLLPLALRVEPRLLFSLSSRSQLAPRRTIFTYFSKNIRQEAGDSQRGEAVRLRMTRNVRLRLPKWVNRYCDMSYRLIWMYSDDSEVELHFRRLRIHPNLNTLTVNILGFRAYVALWARICRSDFSRSDPFNPKRRSISLHRTQNRLLICLFFHVPQALHFTHKGTL